MHNLFTHPVMHSDNTVKKLIILDRDGVINHDSDNYIRHSDEWTPIPGSLEAIAALHQAGYLIAVATNQSGLARGYFDQATLDAMHHKMTQLVEQAGGKITAIEICPHHPDDGCDCRKPKPTMLRSLAKTCGVDLSHTMFVGDSAKDIEAAKAAPCEAVLVRTGKGERTLKTYNGGMADISVYASLADYVSYLLS